MEVITPVAEILGAMNDRSPETTALITKAYTFAETAHHGQKRYSGAPYFVHISAVAKTLADIGMDPTTIVAGLLHDTLEDAAVPSIEIEKAFGKEVLFLVEGVTKLGKLKYRGLERHIESLRKLFISTSKDIRVLIIKLADRLHNVSTLKFVPKEKQKRIALETLEIYAPIADRLSMGKIKGLIEDYCFPFAYPEEFKKVQSLIKERSKESERRLEKMYRTIQKELAKQGMKGVRGEYRVKRTYSLYKKLSYHDWDLTKIFDIAAARVFVPTLEDCYRTLGIVHQLWRPLPGRIKDYIAFPKPNGYRSLHTTVFAGDGGVAEIQIRTEDMNRSAKFGVAAHFNYKEGQDLKHNPKRITKKLGWVKQLTEWQEHAEHGEYLTELREDFFSDRVFVFTPKGDVVDLPLHSAPLDFAFAIHTAIGEHASSAKVNGKMVALDTQLKNGDIVEIITKASAHPSAKWLNYVTTTFAKRQIRSSMQKQEEQKALIARQK